MSTRRATKTSPARVQQHDADRRAVSACRRHATLLGSSASGGQVTTRPLNSAMPRSMSTARVNW
jgi:hypothetical protein